METKHTGEYEALVFDGSQVRLKSLNLDAASEGHALVRVILSGICRTDILVAQGRLDAAVPLVLGHEFSGVVVETGPGCTKVKNGDLVSADPRLPTGTMGIDCDGSFAEYINIPEQNLISYKEDLSVEKTVFTEPLAASMAVLKHLSSASKVLLVGDGRLAKLTERVISLKSNCEVHSSSLADIQEIADDSYDFIVETQLPYDGLKNFIRILKQNATLILKSRPAEATSLDTRLLLQKEITIKSAFYASFQEAAKLIESDELFLDDLVGPRFPLCDFEEAFTLASASEERKVFLF